MKFSEIIKPDVLADEDRARDMFVTFADILRRQRNDTWYEIWSERNRRVDTWAYGIEYFEADTDTGEEVIVEDLKIEWKDLNHDELVSAIDDLLECLYEAT